MTEYELQQRDKAKAYGASDADIDEWLRRNPGHRPGETDIHRLDTAFRPTFSAGGIGGDADLNADGVADAGWVRNPETGSGRQWMRQSELAALSSRALPSSLTEMAGTSAPMLGPSPMLMPARRTPHAVSSLYALAQRGLI